MAGSDINTLGIDEALPREPVAALMLIEAALRSASSRIEAVQVSLPDLEERQKFVEALAAKYALGDGTVNLRNITIPQMARLTAGLKKLHLEDIFLRADTDIPVTPELVKERKKDSSHRSTATCCRSLTPKWISATSGAWNT